MVHVNHLNAEGVADYKTKVEGAGEHTITVNIAYTKPDGTLPPLPKRLNIQLVCLQVLLYSWKK